MDYGREGRRFYGVGGFYCVSCSLAVVRARGRDRGCALGRRSGGGGLGWEGEIKGVRAVGGEIEEKLCVG